MSYFRGQKCVTLACRISTIKVCHSYIHDFRVYMHTVGQASKLVAMRHDFMQNTINILSNEQTVTSSTSVVCQECNSASHTVY